VRSIAAGGALDSNRFSNVIYAGTDGTGPLSTGLPTGGHVWVSTNVSGGSSTWIDQTSSINPQHFPISSIAIDSSDISGQTAYLGIMGFHVSHVWKTTSGGTAWVDFTGNLFDAPVNALLVDAAAGTVYAGTDVGVFASSTVAPNWSEVGPSPGSNKPGFLPNVAVTALHIFNPGANRRLRASTYGRGLWELTRFNLSRPVPAAINIGAPATSSVVTLQLTAASFDSVNLYCTAPLFAKCNFFPGNQPSLSVNVDPQNPFTVTLTVTAMAAAPSGPFQVAIHAAASDATTETQNLVVTVTGGFGFSITNTSGPQTVTAGQAATYNLNVAPSSGTFPNLVTLQCSGLPAPSTCSFNPPQIPAGSGTTKVVLTVTTQAGTPPGTYSAIAVTGTSGFVNASAQLTLTVQSAFSFSLSNSGPATIAAGSSAKYDITVTPSIGTFPNAVVLSFTGCPPQTTCSLSSTQVSAGSGATDVFLTVATSAGTSGTPPGAYTVTVTGTAGSLTASTTIALTVQSSAFSFTMSNSGPSTIAVGSSGKYDITVTPSVGTFPNPVTLTSTGCPAVSTCSLSSAQVAAGSGTTDVFLTIATTPPAVQSEKKRPRILFYALWLPLPELVIVFGGIGAARSRWRLRTSLMLLMMALCMGCGGLQGGSAAPAGNPGTPVGTYTVTVIGTSGALTANTTISLTVQKAQ
jgi:uncharacterized membrane protein